MSVFVRRAVIAVVSIVVPWYVLSLIAGARIVPPPHAVAVRIVTLAPELSYHAAASLGRVIFALAVAVAIALPAGLAMGRSSAADRLLSPAAYALYPVPKIALLPVLLLLLGTGEVARIVLVSLVLFFQVLLAVRDGARSIDPELLLSIDSLGGGWWARIRHVVWPSVLPRLFTAIRIGSATAIAVLFFAETFFTRFGLGYFIVDRWMKLAYPDMYAGIVAMSVLGLAILATIDAVERRVLRWQRVGAGTAATTDRYRQSASTARG